MNMRDYLKRAEKYLNEAEERWVYGTKDKKWQLVGKDDRDFESGITQEEMKKLGKDKAKKKYLSAKMV